MLVVAGRWLPMQVEIPERVLCLAREHAAGDGLDVETWIASAVTAEAMRQVARAPVSVPPPS